MPPAAAAAAALVPAAMGALPGIVAGATGAGKSKARAGNFNETPDYDPTKTQFGGTAGGADAMAGREENATDHYNAAADGQLQNADLAHQQANQSRGLGLDDRGLSLDSRSREAQAQNLMINRANGRNLISTQVANQARTGLRSQLASQAASARGPAALANAQSDAMAAGAQGLGTINQNEQTSSMQEQQAAEQAAFGAANSMAGSDAGLSASDNAMRTNDLGAQGQALGAANNFGNLGLGYTGAENATRATQMQGGIAQQQIASGSKSNSDQLNTKVSEDNAGRDMDYIKMAAGGAAGGAQAGGAMPAPAPAPAAGGATPPPNASDPLSKLGIQGLGLGTPSGTGGGIDIGSKGSFTGADVNAASTGLGGGDLMPGQVGGGGITGGGGGPTGAGGGAGMGSSMFGISDPSAKWGVELLTDKPGQHLQIGNDDKAFYASDAPADDHVTLEGLSSKRPAQDLSIQSSPAKSKAPARHEMSPDELMRAADAMGASMRSEHDARMAQGPAARRLESGTPQTGFTTELTPGAEKSYQDWRTKTSPWDTGADYDLRGAFADGTDRDGRGHLPDTYKKPNHETFSDESTYAQYEPESAGSWHGEKYTAKGPPAWLRQSESVPEASDPRAKELGGVHDNEVAATLDAVPAVSYKYKDASYEPNAQRPGERQAGFLTSDLKQSPLGAAVVERRPDGLEGYNQHRMTGLQHAEIRNLHERMRDLEALAAQLGGGHGR